MPSICDSSNFLSDSPWPNRQNVASIADLRNEWSMESPGPYRHNALDPIYGLVPQIPGTSLGKKILPCNPPTVPLLSSAVSHLPPTPSLQKKSVGICQTIYEPRGAAGLSHRNALLNGILLITWMAGLTTGAAYHQQQY